MLGPLDEALPEEGWQDSEVSGVAIDPDFRTGLIYRCAVAAAGAAVGPGCDACQGTALPAARGRIARPAAAQPGTAALERERAHRLRSADEAP